MDIITLKARYVRSLILPRKKESHKGEFAKVLIIAGSKGFTGAAVLCANGALRSGAGLVTIATPGSQQPIVAKNTRPESMTLALPEEKDGTISFKAFLRVEEFVRKRNISVIAIGPGIRVTEHTARFVKEILKSFRLPIVLDADGINVIRNDINVLKNSKAQIIITPHIGEFSRLINIPVKRFSNNLINIARRFAFENKVVCVLKSHKTIITSGDDVYLNSIGNPGMATGGSGDVLTGAIAALIPQVKPPNLLNAAKAGVFLHGLAGDIAAKKKTQIGMLALDIAESMPDAIKKISIK